MNEKRKKGRNEEKKLLTLITICPSPSCFAGAGIHIASVGAGNGILTRVGGALINILVQRY